MIDVQSQIGNYFLDKCLRFEDLQFVVEVVGHTHHTQVLYGNQSVVVLVLLAVLFFDEYSRFDIVHRHLIAQIYVCCYQADGDTTDEPGPVDCKFHQEGVEVVVFSLWIL